MTFRARLARAVLAPGLIAALFAAPALADQPLNTAPSSDTHAPAVAHDAEGDRFLVVYQAGAGRLEGQIRAGDGTVLVPYLSLLPHRAGLEYREPRVTWKAHNRRWILVAVMEDRSRPLPHIALTVTALDSDGRLVWTYDVPYVANTVRTPDVVADSFPDDCCILIAWKESYGTILGQQINAHGGFIGPRIAIHRDGGRYTDHAFNPRLAYQRGRDEFVAVYQRTYSGGPAKLELRAVRPVSGSLGFLRSSISLVERPRTSYGEHFRGGADIAWDETAQRYLLAWRDERFLRSVLLDREGWMASNPINLFVDDAARGDVLAGGTPEVIAATGRSRFLVTHARSLSDVFGAGRDAWFLEGWWADLMGRFVQYPVSTWWYEQQTRRSVGAWSARTGQAFVVWERDEPAPDFVPVPPRDLYWERLAPR